MSLLTREELVTDSLIWCMLLFCQNAVFFTLFKKDVRKNVRPSLFWDVTRCRSVVHYRRFGKNIGPIFKVKTSCLTLQNITIY